MLRRSRLALQSRPEMRIHREHVLKPRNMIIEKDRKSQHIKSQHSYDHAEIRQIIQQFGSRTEIRTINE